MSEELVLRGNQPAGPQIVARADKLLAQMTLTEKIGQMTQAEKGASHRPMWPNMALARC